VLLNLCAVLTEGEFVSVELGSCVVNCVSGKWLELAQDYVQCQTLVLTALNTLGLLC
jgi:hypothetical protein